MPISRRVLALALVALLLACALLPGQAAALPSGLAISNVTVSDVSAAGFGVSWVTDGPALGWVNYGPDPGSITSRADDIRGQGVSSSIHYVTVGLPQPGQQVYFTVTSGDVTVSQDSSGRALRAGSGPLLPSPKPAPLVGRVRLASGELAGDSVIVYGWLRDADGAGSPGESTRIASLTAPDGSFALDLGARTQDLSSYFAYSAAGDTVVLEAEGGTDGRGGLEVDTTVLTSEDPAGVQLTLSAANPAAVGGSPTAGAAAATPVGSTPGPAPESAATSQPNSTPTSPAGARGPAVTPRATPIGLALRATPRAVSTRGTLSSAGSATASAAAVSTVSPAETAIPASSGAAATSPNAGDTPAGPDVPWTIPAVLTIAILTIVAGVGAAVYGAVRRSREL